MPSKSHCSQQLKVSNPDLFIANFSSRSIRKYSPMPTSTPEYVLGMVTLRNVTHRAESSPWFLLSNSLFLSHKQAIVPSKYDSWVTAA